MTLKFAPPPDRNLKSPKLKVPPGACDCHFHIFGPQAVYPIHPDRTYELEDSTLDDFMALQASLGLSRGLLVQSFPHRFTYDYLLNALLRYPDRLRGVATPAPSITDAELDILTKAGVVGARFGYKVNPKLDLRMIARTHAFGWLPHMLFKGSEEARAWRDDILSLPGDFVLEHMGWQPAAEGMDTDGYRILLELLDTGRCWIKLSHKPAAQKALPYSDVIPMVHDLVRRAPERLLWGTDWPHPNTYDPVPNDADLMDLLLDWIPDESTRNRILVDNPAALFGFHAHAPAKLERAQGLDRAAWDTPA